MLELEVTRTQFTKRSTTGKLLNGETLVCCTLEPPQDPDPDGNGFVCIPEGTYPLTIRWSPKFGRAVPHVECVPGRSAIEMHIGNSPSDTDGCTVVGEDYGTPLQADWVGNSAKAFAALMALLYANATLTNPSSPEVSQLWTVGTISYINSGESQ
jgi:hypothetical protein